LNWLEAQSVSLGHTLHCSSSSLSAIRSSLDKVMCENANPLDLSVSINLESQFELIIGLKQVEAKDSKTET
jgi:hypothetical protein